ncbi:MAG: enoyl-CoA hydratase-related protein [Acidimicrobiales bacterium]
MAVHVEAHGDHVRVLTIDRPERRNALDRETLGQLEAAIVGADVRVLVLRGAGGHFCAGADLAGVEDAGFATVLKGVLTALRDAPFPTIAAVEGAALGAGTQLAVACDLRTAVGTAVFGIPAAKLGLMVDHWTVQRLALLAGHGPARAMLLAADVVNGQDAHSLGLVQRGARSTMPSVGRRDRHPGWLTIAGHKLMLNHIEADPAPTRPWPLRSPRPGTARTSPRAWPLSANTASPPSEAAEAQFRPACP